MIHPDARGKALDLALLILRLLVGLWFAYHGAQKVFGAFGGGGMDKFIGYLEFLEVPMPTVSAWLAALAELVGGLFIALGLLTRFAVVPAAVTMLVAMFSAHAGEFAKWELPSLYLAAFVFFGLVGAGSFSLDARLFGRRES